jgi:purine nucleosidase
MAQHPGLTSEACDISSQMRLLAVLWVGVTAWAQGVSPIRPTPAPEIPRRIILDTDPGIDDAMAVLLALRSPELKVEAVTTVAGNVPVELGAENARKLVELAGRPDVIVAKGAARPLQRTLITAEAIHGENGLGGVVLPAPKIGLDRRHAVQVIHDVIDANPGHITLVPVGPLTNIAMAFLEYPDLSAKTREIILMGGTVGAGNATPAAEANVHQDAEAAKIVFESGVPILMVDLTACAQALLTRNEASRLRESADPAGKFVAAISESYIRFAESSGSAGAAIHDALAVGIAIDPLVAKTVRPVHVDVETKGEFTYGATVTNLRLTVEHSERRGDRFAIVDFPAVKPNAAYPAVVDGQRFVQMFVKRMTQAPAGGK